MIKRFRIYVVQEDEHRCYAQVDDLMTRCAKDLCVCALTYNLFNFFCSKIVSKNSIGHGYLTQ